MENRRSIFGPLLLIAAGSIWLLVKSGNIPSANLWALTHVWPFLLIAAGVSIILRPYWKYTGILMDIIIIGGLVMSIVYAPTFGWATPAMGFASWDGSEVYFGPGDPGAGVMKTETRAVSDFHAIEIEYPALITITQGKAVLADLAGELDGLDLEAIVFPHYLSGPLDGRQRLEFLRFHMERHIGQIRRIQSHPAYPE